MSTEFDRDDYSLRVMIEDMQQKGNSEREIEAAVRDASRRLERKTRPASRRPGIRQRLLGTSAR